MIRLLLLIVPLLLCCAQDVQAQQERIRSFVSEIRIQPDATVLVRETIIVQAAGNKIKRGIYRDFPTLYTDRLGNALEVPFELYGIFRDGKGESYHTERHGNGIRVYIGKENVFLPPGEHTYEITYATRWQLGFFAGYDELYWNVTGNGWEFPIDYAEALVTLPQGAPVVQQHAYTGYQGDTGAAYAADTLDDGRLRFVTTRALDAQQGLTVAVAWPKGFVAEPTQQEKLERFVYGNLAAAAGLLGVLALFAYYYITWSRVGRDPEQGTIYPQYGPPQGLSPASVRTLMRMGSDNKTFATAIVGLAQKDRLRIEEEGKTFVLVKTAGGRPPLTADEQVLFDKLLGSRARLSAKQENHAIFSTAKKALETRLALQHEKLHFLKNSKYLIPGILLSAAVLLVVALSARERAMAGFMMVWLSFWSVGVYFLLRTAITAWLTRSYVTAFFMSLFSIPFVVGEVVGLGALAYATSPLAALCLLAMAGLHVLFYELLKAPTPEGRQIMDAIAGYKLFLSVTEGPRLELMQPIAITPDVYEKHFPYAMALDVEKQWGERFSQAMASAGQYDSDYHPAWYLGTRFHSVSSGDGFATSFASAFSSAISSSSTAPGSSSGSGGGGSSGGGGGGGGGGGW
ncbi:DUF2207 domain-containing protein [Megalodesulfovibrio gigas]|uniref:Putative transmembrane signal peptide protein n=1 Tax=Megalodesulfovibrio gigas (strain ATCC 19364 / DSM 1382 / NCIMB 9332 / VKM B-1759) TaxID=1121448 RepID=T2GF64_MEGG1|nr:DUF2207 domain-containing protein [Megalodesulfovibrio gigas]AGW14819.1 putative transmembrane signal peptide protein [Megalodesulfovibrio gigas DSM 1382 = ATCC 19364]